ncbi:hypothetical protein MMC13_001673 [Lambiella insularis]|nr:hypothetical protein [Lambiella insularis]
MLSTPPSGIAIIGMSCRVAGANSPSELWDLLASSKDVQSEITRFNARGYYSPDGGPRQGMTSVKDAYTTDPQQRMLLELSYEAIERAGIPMEQFVGTDTAVFAGMEGTDYHTVLARDIDATPRYLATGTATCMGANRISYFYNLSGPSMTVDTACSSTMAALHQAVLSLDGGAAGMALVCGAKLIINPDMFMPSSELGFLSPSGRCRSFDAAGDGYGRGEGGLVILLKPLARALADGDPVRAVIKGTRLNQDGRTQGITLPSAKVQKHNMECLYKQLNLSPSEIQYVEAHGTGTAAGDPLEFAAINAVFGGCPRSEKLIVGSVKSNIGHLEAPAALAGIIKAVECLERSSIPPQMQFTKPNPKINFDNVHVPVEMVKWPRVGNGIRRAAINTFGAGETNGHCVLESYPKQMSQVIAPARALLFRVTANDKLSLRRLSLQYPYTLLARRSTLNCSVFFAAKSREDIGTRLKDETLRVCTTGNPHAERVVFVFTGQGAQWPSMGKDLLASSHVFKTTIQECEDAMTTLPDRPTWSLKDELAKPVERSNVYQAAYSQPLCTALQIGLVAMWKHFGLSPSAVIGHSSGQIAGASAAGILSLRDAMVVAYYRGLCIRSLNGSHRGGMCAVGLSETESRTLLEPFGNRIQLATINSPTSCTLSGDGDALDQVATVCKEMKVFCRALRSEIAYHSHHILCVAEPYEKALANAGISPVPSKSDCEMFSSVTGQRSS